MVTAEKLTELEETGDEEKQVLVDALKHSFVNFENCIKGTHKSFNNKSLSNFKKNNQAHFNTIAKFIDQEIEDPNTWLLNISGLALYLNKSALNDVAIKALSTALDIKYTIPESLIIDWKLTDKVNLKPKKDAKDSDSEEFFDASDALVTTLKCLATSLAQNKILKIETLKYPTQNVVSWFERFELLTTRWTEEDRGLEVVSYFPKIPTFKI